MPPRLVCRASRRGLVVVASVLLAGLVAASPAADDAPAIDFSTAGYAAGRHRAPTEVPAILTVAPSGGDDTALLQAALDALARKPARSDGFRGALLLGPGTFQVAGQLRIRADGVVLRGSGPSATEIVALGRDRRTLLEIGTREPPEVGPALEISDAGAPAGTRVLPVADVSTFRIGDRVVVTRPSTAAWIAALGMDRHPGHFANQRTDWLPGSRDLVWDRVVEAVDPSNHALHLDAPITTALEPDLGGGTVARVTARGPLLRIGVEALALRSAYDAGHPADEEHAWIGVALDGVEDAWVRDVTFRHFVGSAVRIGPRARRVSITGCTAGEPVSELGGYRRQVFLVEGQQVLVQDCSSDQGMNDFALGHCAAGPVVFQDCVATRAEGPSGPFESWAAGFLYSRVRVDPAGIRAGLDETRAQGAGWTAAHGVISECTPVVAIPGPAGPNGAGIRVDPATPASFARLGGGASPVSRSAAGAFETAVPFTLDREQDGSDHTPTQASGHVLDIVGGRFVAGDRVVWGGQLNAAWWKGQISPAVAARSSGRSITRWAPGRIGPGLTEDLDQLADDMIAHGQAFYAGGPGLWYDRRRDDHLVHAREDALVWAPFYEMPWARSGRGRAFDGLSLFDLEQFNPWYFERTRAFAKACEARGLVVFCSVYNTHNMLETLAHYADYPWRPANTLTDTALPEPPPIDPNTTIHLADQIYDASHPAKRRLHRALIRRHLETLADCPNAILNVGFQFAGPLAFQQFFLDEVAAWERETARNVRVALATSKDITDAILADPARAAIVDVVDMRYWQQLADGRLWAPPGDRNRAFRELNAEMFGRGVDTPPDATPLGVYRMVRDYRQRCPDKAIAAWHGGAGQVPVLMAGGAQVHLRNPAAGQSQGATSDATPLDAFVRAHLARVLMHMEPRDGWFADPEHVWCLADRAGSHVLVSSHAEHPIRLERALPRPPQQALWLEVETGRTVAQDLPDGVAPGATLPKPAEGAWLVLLRTVHER